ncbi:class I SAM-dependent methyltransferase [Aeromicrobium phragmitis]|uniref:Class I SAM-dependent methyltransferase n=1 Tax=Aeromicrobium phragmitis TaxID=2478914 RepID=A0A3L8PS18_9ACTN|nr:methyltransferase domain-containing protein [Aeromicrobium phragmitis]RLV57453.1 class I SAM-dependent methyltransferase [Aeromicrobium phragmitis]
MNDPDAATPILPGFKGNTIAPLTPYAQLRWEIVAPLFPRRTSRVLEVGCGQGSFGVRIGSAHDYTGVELDEASASVAQQRFDQAGIDGTIVCGPVSSLPASESFDIVCAFEVLEHIEDDAAALDEWVSRLRPGGLVVLSVPAWQSRFGPMDEAVGHYRRYDPAGLSALLSGAGLQNVGTRLYGAPLGYVLEGVRNQLAGRRASLREDGTVADRTARSGRLFQPSSSVAGTLTSVGTWPFRKLQRAFPNRGTALVAWGTTSSA